MAAKLMISSDQGSSASKTLYQVNDGRTGVVVMEPQILTLPQSSIDIYKASRGALNNAWPENDAWLSFKKTADDCIVLGHLAKQFHGTPKLTQLKFEQGAAKLMAVIGAIIQKEGLDREIEVAVSTLLPFGEYTNREQLKEKFQKEAKNYYFRNQKINVYTDEFKCLPEGAGFIAGYARKHGENWFAQRKIVVLMCGHRNTSLLVFDKGSLTHESQTTSLGFIRLVESVMQCSSLDNAELLTQAIYGMGSSITSDDPNLRILLKSFHPENFERESKALVDVIENAREEYWALLTNWLEAAVPRQLDEMIIAGGGAYYLKNRLDQLFAWAEPAWNADERSEELRQLLSHHPDSESLLVRFRDVYALHFAMYQEAIAVHK
ncbi:MAG: ParM/StbA family protein [Thainema sp.]